jgi:hypothetical protein
MGSGISETDDFHSIFDHEFNGAVINTQTTYLDLEVSSHKIDKAHYRVHFDQKQEFYLEKGTFTRVSVTDKHPLLIDYDEVRMDVHLKGWVEEKSEFAKALQRAALSTFGKWRTYDRYMIVPLDQFLERAYGVLMTAPKSFAQNVIDLGPAFAVELFLRNERTPQGKFKVLLIDDLYVVANDFRFQLIVDS